MALRIPLVIVNGQIQQLQSGDTLNAVNAGADGIIQTNDQGATIPQCAPVYNDANDGVKLAEANAAATTGVLGLAFASIPSPGTGTIQLDGVLSAPTASWDAAFGTTGGLTAGTRYFLSPSTAGTGTATAPSTTGQYVVPLGLAVSTTQLLLAAPFTPILL